VPGGKKALELIGAPSTLGGGIMQSHPISLEGPVELVDGQLSIRIPLEAGGSELAPLAKGIAEVRDGCLVVVIEPWLAEKLRIEEGSLVLVDNCNGKFNITKGV
jgi:hypothetical protein